MRSNGTRRTISLVATLAAVVLGSFATGACGGSSAADEEAELVTTTTVVAETSTTAAASELDAARVEDVAGLVANTDHELAVYANIGDAAPGKILAASTEFGSRRVLAVVGWQGTGGEWLEVLLPERPNGSRGFVKAADVTLTGVDLLVDVDLAARTLRVVDRDNGVVLETAVAVGSAENPTPTGDFFLTDILVTGDDGSAYGPYALGVSAHSDSLSEFGGGDGQIGIHGTNQPSSIGEAVSHGCVRVPNDVVTTLATTLPLGTPVAIH
jgi:lipoprotein-anchoring transpeptidase ErfK/SrfK